jgi:dGTPase
MLAPYACDPAHSRGRRYPQSAAPTRTEFQRDRDRIVHSSAFRRLVYKTQVFLNHEGDLFRTRMTHSLEVAQLGRSMARTLGLNEDLVEAIALAHDLGHTPFGHAGQDALHDCMRDWGGFEHNMQSLRVVDQLEQRYPEYDGLNLCFETREGILKHCSAANARALEAQEPRYADLQGGVGARFLLRQQPSLEAQLCNLADEIAYNAHDIDDGVRSGLITLEHVREVPLFARFSDEALREQPQLGASANRKRWLYESIRRMLSAQVYDVIEATRAQIVAHQVRDLAGVRAAAPLVVFSAAMVEEARVLKAFLLRALYRHPNVVEKMDAARAVVCGLFALYIDDPGQMAAPGTSMDATTDTGLQRRVADYVAGMTDRFALREHERLTGQRLLV